MTPLNEPDLAHAGDEQLEAALEQAELPSLMPALAYLTGDMALVGSDLRPRASGPIEVVLAAQGGMTTAQQALARQRALDALIAFRDGGCVPAPPSARLADQRALMTFMTGDVDDRYLPMLSFELGLPADTDAPDWTKEAVAPGRNFRVAVIGAGMSGLAVAYRLLQAGIDFVVFERNDDVGGVAGWRTTIPAAASTPAISATATPSCSVTTGRTSSRAGRRSASTSSARASSLACASASGSAPRCEPRDSMSAAASEKLVTGGRPARLQQGPAASAQ